MSKYGIFPGPYFPVFGINTEIYFVYPEFSQNTGKYGAEKNSVFGHFSRSVGVCQGANDTSDTGSFI